MQWDQIRQNLSLKTWRLLYRFVLLRNLLGAVLACMGERYHKTEYFKLDTLPYLWTHLNVVVVFKHNTRLITFIRHRWFL